MLLFNSLLVIKIVFELTDFELLFLFIGVFADDTVIPQ